MKYSRKNNCQEILSADSITMLTKRDFILRGKYFCEKYNLAIPFQLIRDTLFYRFPLNIEQENIELTEMIDHSTRIAHICKTSARAS